MDALEVTGLDAATASQAEEAKEDRDWEVSPVLLLWILPEEGTGARGEISGKTDKVQIRCVGVGPSTFSVGTMCTFGEAG